MFPDTWNVKQQHDGRMAWYSQLSIGLVGNNVRSHQAGPPVPMPVIVQLSSNLLLLHCWGAFAFLSFYSAMLTSPSSQAIRAMLRRQAVQEWQRRPVQGKIASMHPNVYTPCLDMSFYTSCPAIPPPSPLRLPHDESNIDLRYTLQMPSSGWWWLD
eukprot:s3832_g7.t1